MTCVSVCTVTLCNEKKAEQYLLLYFKIKKKRQLYSVTSGMFTKMACFSPFSCWTGGDDMRGE